MKNTAYNVNVSQDGSLVQRSQTYASAKDFCAIFRDDADSLYSLALALTGSHEAANKVFLAALDECRDGSVVFQEWARPWSRRTIIKSAIRLLDPVRSDASPESKTELEAVASQMHPAASRLFHLSRFERFVFVMSVLEGYTVRECAALLGAGPREVEQARVHALQQASGKNQNIVPGSYVNNSLGAVNSILSLH